MRQRTLVTRAARMEVTPRGNFEFEGHNWLLLLPENLDLVFLRLLGVVVCEELLQCIAVRKVANGRGSRARERARKHSVPRVQALRAAVGNLTLWEVGHSQVGAAHFHAVPDLFVPTLNDLRGCLDQAQLRSHAPESAD